MGFPLEYIYLLYFPPEYIYLVQSTLHSVFVGLVVRVRYVRTHLLGLQHIWLTPAPGRPAQYTVPAAVTQAVCIATPGSARINVAYRLYSVDKLY